MARLKIYGIARTRAFRVLWMAEEIGLDYEHIAIETGAAGARQPGYLAVNPNGRLPAIDDDGFVMWESLAINIYLAKKHATGTLYPATPQGEAKVAQWSLWAANEIERATNVWSFHAERLPPAERDPKIAAAAIELLAPPFRVLDRALAEQPYLLGGRIHGGRPQCCGGRPALHCDGSVGDAALPRLAATLLRPAGRPEGVPAAPGGRGGRCDRHGPRGGEKEPALTINLL